MRAEPLSINRLIDAKELMMERVVTATEARIHFGEMIRRATDDQEVIIVERSGEPQVVLLSLDRYRRLTADNLEKGAWRERVDRARDLIAQELGDRALPPAEVMIRRMREERDAQLLDLR